MSSSDCENYDVEQRAKDIIDNLLPPKSRKIYLKTYESFMDWRNKKRINSFTESVFLAYFDEMSKKYQSSTLWSIYSMLKITVKIKHEVQMKTYGNLIALLKRLSSGHKGKKSKVFTSEDVETFLNNAPNEKYLATKVCLCTILRLLTIKGNK